MYTSRCEDIIVKNISKPNQTSSSSIFKCIIITTFTIIRRNDFSSVSINPVFRTRPVNHRRGEGGCNTLAGPTEKTPLDHVQCPRPAKRCVNVFFGHHYHTNEIGYEYESWREIRDKRSYKVFDLPI